MNLFKRLEVYFKGRRPHDLFKSIKSLDNFYFSNDQEVVKTKKIQKTSSKFEGNQLLEANEKVETRIFLKSPRNYPQTSINFFSSILLTSQLHSNQYPMHATRKIIQIEQLNQESVGKQKS